MQRLARLHHQRRFEGKILHSFQLLVERDIVHLAELRVHAFYIGILMAAVVYNKEDSPVQGIVFLQFGKLGVKHALLRRCLLPGEGAVGPVAEHPQADMLGYMIDSYEGYMHSSVMRVRSTKYMDMSLFPEPDPTWFFPYKAFLYKWRTIYNRRAIECRINYVMHGPHNQKEAGFDHSRPAMEADQDQMEQVAYNLTNNAFKYARAGTTIEVDCKLDKDNPSIYEFTVSNYGFPLKVDELEELGTFDFRGSNAPEGTDGSGLGLWYCQGVAHMHKGILVKPTVVDIVSEYDFTSLLVFNLLDMEGKKSVFYKMEEARKIAVVRKKKEMHEAQKKCESEQDETAFYSMCEIEAKCKDELEKLEKPAFVDFDDMRSKLAFALEELKQNPIWNECAANFQLMSESQTIFTAYFAGKNIMRGTARFTFGVRIPKTFKGKRQAR